jgi:hypothetical protein
VGYYRLYLKNVAFVQKTIPNTIIKQSDNFWYKVLKVKNGSVLVLQVL